MLLAHEVIPVGLSQRTIHSALVTSPDTPVPPQRLELFATLAAQLIGAVMRIYSLRVYLDRTHINTTRTLWKSYQGVKISIGAVAVVFQPVS